MLAEFAAAKINLTLAVTGQRADGYHLIDTLVAFADLGDRLAVRSAAGLSLDVDGPFAADLVSGTPNLAMRAAETLQAAAFGGDPGAPGAHLRLHKALPVASGIGGGSADAAAALRALNRLWKLDWSLERLAALGLRIGADVPMCLYSLPLRATGIGGDIETLAPFPALDLVLVNPGVAVSTASVFAGLGGRFVKPKGPADDLASRDALIAHLESATNDLEAPATAAAPVIGEVLAAIRATGKCRLARMSGSGATCFGLCDDADAARSAASALSAAHGRWWVRSTVTSPAALPAGAGPAASQARGARTRG